MSTILIFGADSLDERLRLGFIPQPKVQVTHAHEVGDRLGVLLFLQMPLPFQFGFRFRFSYPLWPLFFDEIVDLVDVEANGLARMIEFGGLCDL